MCIILYGNKSGPIRNGLIKDLGSSTVVLLEGAYFIINSGEVGFKEGEKFDLSANPTSAQLRIKWTDESRQSKSEFSGNTTYSE